MAEIAAMMQRLAEDLLARPSGPLALRFVLQPLTAAALAVRDGMRDARAGRSPYLGAILTEPRQRQARLREGLVATARLMAMALALDAAYQLIRLGTFYPGEAAIIVAVFAFLPYLLIRGPVGRLCRRVHGATGGAVSRTRRGYT